MRLFSKKKEEPASCCCGGNCTPETMAHAEAVKASSGVKVLGSGCAKCNALAVSYTHLPRLNFVTRRWAGGERPAAFSPAR